MDARCVRKTYITGTEKRRIMKKTGSNRIISAALAAALVLTGTGCGKAADGSQSSVSEAVSSTAAAAQTSSSAASTSATSTSAASTSAASSGSVEKVVIGTEGAYAPYNLVNENGDPDGYDIAVAKAVDELVPELEFTFQPTEWSSIFTALDSGRFNIIVSQIAKNDEREKKYLFSDTAYTWDSEAIIYAKGRTDIHSTEDLDGKTVDAGLGSANTTWLEDYNKKNGNKIKISYTDGDVSKMLQDVVNGRADATINDPVTTKLIADKQGLQVDWTVSPDEGITPTYFLFANNEEGKKYKALIDPALKKLLDDGTLAKLSKQYLGADFSTKEAVEAQGSAGSGK